MRNCAYAIAAALLVLCLPFAPARAAGCGPDSPPDVRLKIEESPVRFDLSRTIAQLDHHTPVSAAMPAGYHADTAGTMNGLLELDHRVLFDTYHLDGNACASLRTVEITLRMRPLIYVASDLQQKTCMFRQIFNHESRHIDIDRAVLAKYKERIRDGMTMATSMPADYKSSWVEDSKLEAEKLRLQRPVEDALGVMFQSMMEDRNRQQSQVDTLEEYLTISLTCQSAS